MRRFVAMMLGLSTFFVWADAPERPTPKAWNVITGTLDVLVSGNLCVDYERAVSNHFTLFLGPSLSRGGLANWWDSNAWGKFGVGLIGGARLYVFGNAPDGLWLGHQVSATLGLAHAFPLSNAEVGAMAGYTFAPSQGMALSFGAGAAYRWGGPASTGFQLGTLFPGPVIPIARLAIGYAF